MWNACSKLGVRIKTTVSATVLEEALNGSVVLSQLQLGSAMHRKVGIELSTSSLFPF
jgi:hypothetical protein